MKPVVTSAAIAGIAVAALLVNAHATSGSSQYRAGSGWLSPQAAAGKNLLYVADIGDSNIQSGVYIYNIHGQMQQPIGVITSGISGAEGIAIDAKSDLYVANHYNNTVTFYPLGHTTPTVTYSQGIVQPYSDAVGTDGTLYVANFGVNPQNGDGTVTEYPAGTTSPSVTLARPGYDPTGVVLDASNNLYVGWFSVTTFSNQVFKYAPGATHGTNLGLQLPQQTFPLYALAFDQNGNLVLWSESLDHSKKFLGSYAPGKTMPNNQIFGGSLASTVFGIAFPRHSSGVYIMAWGEEVTHLAYPGDIPLDMINLESADYVALSPDV